MSTHGPGTTTRSSSTHRIPPAIPHTALERMRAAPAVSVAIAAMCSTWLLSASFPLEQNAAGLLLLPGVLLTLLFRLALAPAVLFAVLLAIALTAPRSILDAVTPYDRIIAGCLLILLLSLQRCQQLPELPGLKPFRQRIAERLPRPRRLRMSRPSCVPDSTAFHTGSAGSELLWIAVRGGAAVVTATWLLALVPYDLEAPATVGLIPTAQRTILLGGGIAVTVVLAGALLNTAGWRRLSPRAARVFLHSELAEWCGRELRAILRLEDRTKRRRN